MHLSTFYVLFHHKESDHALSAVHDVIKSVT